MSLTALSDCLSLRTSNTPSPTLRLPAPGADSQERSMGQQIGESLQGPVGLFAAVIGTSLGFGGMREGLKNLEGAKLPSAEQGSSWAKERDRLRKQFASDQMNARFGLQHDTPKKHNSHASDTPMLAKHDTHSLKIS